MGISKGREIVMIVVEDKLRELIEMYEKEATDEVAHQIVKCLKSSLNVDKPRSTIVLDFLRDHCYSFQGRCETYVDNIPGHSYGTFYVDSDTIELMEVASAANTLKRYIIKNFAK